MEADNTDHTDAVQLARIGNNLASEFETLSGVSLDAIDEDISDLGVIRQLMRTNASIITKFAATYHP